LPPLSLYAVLRHNWRRFIYRRRDEHYSMYLDKKCRLFHRIQKLRMIKWFGELCYDLTLSVLFSPICLTVWRALVPSLIWSIWSLRVVVTFLLHVEIRVSWFNLICWLFHILSRGFWRRNMWKHLYDLLNFIYYSSCSYRGPPHAFDTNGLLILVVSCVYINNYTFACYVVHIL